MRPKYSISVNTERNPVLPCVMEKKNPQTVAADFLLPC